MRFIAPQPLPDEFVYLTRDLSTDPPTPLAIVRNELEAHERTMDGFTVFCVAECHVEPTIGWAQRAGKPQLSVCFSHSYGKCAGRSGSDPATCHQLHIQRDALAAMRSKFLLPRRQQLCRTVKVNVSEDVKRAVSEYLPAGKALQMHYLEFPTTEVLPSAGLDAYDEQYRAWLHRELAPQEKIEPFTCKAIHLCTSFCILRNCPMKELCTMIHVPLRAAQTRDPLVAEILRKMSADPAGPADDDSSCSSVGPKSNSGTPKTSPRALAPVKDSSPLVMHSQHSDSKLCEKGQQQQQQQLKSQPLLGSQVSASAPPFHQFPQQYFHVVQAHQLPPNTVLMMVPAHPSATGVPAASRCVQLPPPPPPPAARQPLQFRAPGHAGGGSGLPSVRVGRDCATSPSYSIAPSQPQLFPMPMLQPAQVMPQPCYWVVGPAPPQLEYPSTCSGGLMQASGQGMPLQAVVSTNFHQESLANEVPSMAKGLWASTFDGNCASIASPDDSELSALVQSVLSGY